MIIFLDLAQEKTIENLGAFDKESLKKTETEVKQILPSCEGLLSR